MDGYYAGRIAADWAKEAGKLAATNPNSNMIIQYCYNAGKAALGSSAPWAQIQSYAQTLFRSLVR